MHTKTAVFELASFIHDGYLGQKIVFRIPRIVVNFSAHTSDRLCKQGGGKGYCGQGPWQEALSAQEVSFWGIILTLPLLTIINIIHRALTDWKTLPVL